MFRQPSAPSLKKNEKEQPVMPETIQRTPTNGVQPAKRHVPPPTPPRRPRSSDKGGYWAAFALLLGMLVVVLGFVAVWMGFSAHDARNDAKKAASGTTAGNSMAGMDMSGGATGSGELTSYAGQAPAKTAALPKRPVPLNPGLPPVPPR